MGGQAFVAISHRGNWMMPEAVVSNAVRLRLSRVAVVAILIITAIPAELRDPRTIEWRLIFSFRDVVGNILLFVPLGLYLQSSLTLRSVTVFAGGLSLAIELAQLFFVRRNSQPSDVVSNMLGAVCGAIAGRYLGVRSDTIKFGTSAGLGALATATVWSVAYIAARRTLPPFVGRGSVAVVAFLCALGFTGTLKPRRTITRILVGMAGGATGAIILSPTGPLLLPSIAIGLVFGTAVFFCTSLQHSDDL